MSERIESRLADLAAHVELPPAPDIAARVRARVEAEPPRRAWRLRPALAVPLALLALAVGGVAAVPSARSAVLRWLGIEGVKIERVPKAPTPAPTSSPLDLGERTTLTSGVLVPDALGRPDAVYDDGDQVTLLYRPRRGLPESAQTGAGALLSQFPGRTTAGVHPQAGGAGDDDRARPRRRRAGLLARRRGPQPDLRGPLRHDPRVADAARRPHPGLAARRSHAAPRGRRHQVAGARDRPLRPMRREPTMQRTLVLAAVAALALAVAPAAVAKEIKEAQMCGADGCTTVDDGGDREILVNGGPPRTPPAAAPFYNLRIVVDTGGGHSESLDIAAVPERRALRGADGTWMEMPPEMVTRGHEARRGPPGAPGVRPDRRRAGAGAAPGSRRHRQPALARGSADRARAGRRRRLPRARRAWVAEVRARVELARVRRVGRHDRDLRHAPARGRARRGGPAAARHPRRARARPPHVRRLPRRARRRVPPRARRPAQPGPVGPRAGRDVDARADGGRRRRARRGDGLRPLRHARALLRRLRRAPAGRRPARARGGDDRLERRTVRALPRRGRGEPGRLRARRAARAGDAIVGARAGGADRGGVRSAAARPAPVPLRRPARSRASRSSSSRTAGTDPFARRAAPLRHRRLRRHRGRGAPGRHHAARARALRAPRPHLRRRGRRGDRRRHPGAELVVFEDSGHFSYVEENEAYLGAVRRFLQSVP